MIWKVVVVLRLALYVQCDEDAISEQRVVIHHHKFDRSGSISDIGHKKPENDKEYASSYPSYEFSYKVNDPETLDIKGQHETREGDEVTGNYWLIEPNGRKRTVNYQANDDKGFNAQIAFTASLKGKESIENADINQSKDLEQRDFENNNDEREIELNTDEAAQDIENVDEVTSDIPNEPENKEISSNRQNNQNEDDFNNASNIEENVGSVTKENIVEATSRITVANEVCCVKSSRNPNAENNGYNLNKRRRKNRANNESEKNKRGKSKRNKNQIQSSISNINKNNQNELLNENRLVQNNLDTYKNYNNRGTNNQKQHNRNGNIRNPEKTKSSQSKGIGRNRQINKNGEQNVIIQNRITEKENDNDNNQNVDQNNNNLAVIQLTPNDNIANEKEIYEHRIRIYHPKPKSAK